MDLSAMLDLISNTTSDTEKAFYTNIYNFVMQERQKECVANGVF